MLTVDCKRKGGICQEEVIKSSVAHRKLHGGVFDWPLSDGFREEL